MKKYLFTILLIGFWGCEDENESSKDTFFKTYGGSDSEVGYSLIELNDNSIVVVGSTESYGSGNTDIYIIKTNTDGDKIWEKTFGDTARDFGYSIDALDDEIIVAGKIRLNETENPWLSKFDSDGNELWNNSNFGEVYEGCFL